MKILYDFWEWLCDILEKYFPCPIPPIEQVELAPTPKKHPIKVCKETYFY